jgi:addiction module HigA family antidote
MQMFNPPHPGEFIQTIYLEPFDLSISAISKNLGVSDATVNQLVSGEIGINPELALRLSKGLGRSPESWLAMQNYYDLWQVQQFLDLSNVHQINFEAA